MRRVPAAALVSLLSAKPLDPEESTTLSLGVVLRPTSTSSVTIDAYQLDIDDVITITDTIQGQAVTNAFTALGLAGYTQATYYLNAWDMRTRGIDLVGRQQFSLLSGKLDLTAQEFSPETYIDLGFDYVLREGLRLSLLVQNVFDEYPDEYVDGNRSSGINPYSFIAPNGASGRFVQGGVTVTF